MSRHAHVKHGRGNARVTSLSLERLEPRLLLSGNVVAAVAGGNLVVTGDGAGNEITVEQTGVGQYTVTGVGTSVNGGGAFVANGVTGDFRFDMAGGDDDVDVIGTTLISGGVRADMGSGDNNFRIQDFTTVADDLKVTAGGGDDVVRVWNDAVVQGKVDIRIGDGDNEVQIWNDSRIDGKVRVSTGAGDDEIMIWNDSQIGGNVSLVTGAGDDEVMVWNDSQIIGKLALNTGAGDDEVDIRNETVLHSKVRLDMGGGDDLVDIRNEANFFDKLDVRTGDGLDTVSIDGSGSGLMLNGDVKISHGIGDSNTTIDNSTIGGKLQVRGNDQQDTVALNEVSVAGDTKIGLGLGADVVQIDDATFNGRVSIATGHGLSTVAIETTGDSFAPITTFNGRLIIKGGGQGDMLTVGQAGKAGRSIVANAAVSYRGGGDVDTVDHLGNGNTYAVAPTVRGYETVL